MVFGKLHRRRICLGSKTVPSPLGSGFIQFLAGGLAGLYYGEEAISGEWIEVLAKKDDIQELIERMSCK